MAQASVCNMTLGCRMANIPREWVATFAYSPVIAPRKYKVLAHQTPATLWHPVKSGTPLDGKSMDEAWRASTFAYQPAASADPLARTAASLDWAGCLGSGVVEEGGSGGEAEGGRRPRRKQARFGNQVHRPWLERIDPS